MPKHPVSLKGVLQSQKQPSSEITTRSSKNIIIQNIRKITQKLLL